MSLKMDLTRAVLSGFMGNGGPSAALDSNINLKRTFLGGLDANETQTDVAHMAYFNVHGLFLHWFGRFHGTKLRAVPLQAPCYSEHAENCQAEHYVGSWFDSQKCVDRPPENIEPYEKSSLAYLESLMLCKPPYFFNTGSHRVAAVFWLNAARYAIAFEEGYMRPDDHVSKPCNRYDMVCIGFAVMKSFHQDSINENVFIEPLTLNAVQNLKSPEFVSEELIPSAVLAVTGNPPYPGAHKFRVYIEEFQSGGVLVSGCKPSPDAYEY